ncbi:PH domain-containing protein [Cohnella sp. AR92]|uniref:PH domain-containing protein n=1 Tax=Cohnella sp. AR92 TaxID=648716 RepID=UPI0013155980|nr:PH domain-containing protein [Cohnella sp. AR92]
MSVFNRNSYFDDYFKQIAEPGENDYYYFYVMKLASFSKYLIFQGGAFSSNRHMIVCVTNKRVLICQMDQTTGRLTGNMAVIALNDVRKILLKKGFMKTSVKIEFPDDSALVFKPNNWCIGLSNHKKHLLKLQEVYG